MFTLSANIKAQFFDRPLMNAVDRGTKSALSKAGAYVRRADKSSLKYGKGSSAKGKPPIVHRNDGYTRKKKSRKTGAESRQPASPLRELIFFAYEPNSKSVIIGPQVFGNSKIGAGVAPRIIEEGGVGPVLSHGKLYLGHYAARPHTGPALKSVLPQVPAMFKNQIR